MPIVKVAQKFFLFLSFIRVVSWCKNLFIFAPLFFAKTVWHFPSLLNVAVVALAFCFVASTVYVLNDLVDIARDQNHPTKKLRPLASGMIKRKTAVWIFMTLLLIDAYFFFTLSTNVGFILLLYALLNVFYSFFGKHIPLLDILLVASFYVLRIIIGGIAAGVPVSSWLIMSTIFIALLLITGKRKSELQHTVRRPVLEHYSEPFLNALLIMAASLTLVSYSLYILIVHAVPFAVYTIFFVLLGIMRYLLLVYNGHNVESIEKMIWKDRTLGLSILGWIVAMYFIFYSNV